MNFLLLIDTHTVLERHSVKQGVTMNQERHIWGTKETSYNKEGMPGKLKRHQR